MDFKYIKNKDFCTVIITPTHPTLEKHGVFILQRPFEVSGGAHSHQQIVLLPRWPKKGSGRRGEPSEKVCNDSDRPPFIVVELPENDFGDMLAFQPPTSYSIGGFEIMN